jgi:hypothetical protein
VSDDVLALLTEISTEYDCGSYPEAVEIAAVVALKPDPADLARILADRLADQSSFQ